MYRGLSRTQQLADAGSHRNLRNLLNLVTLFILIFVNIKNLGASVPQWCIRWLTSVSLHRICKGDWEVFVRGLAKDISTLKVFPLLENFGPWLHNRILSVWLSVFLSYFCKFQSADRIADRGVSSSFDDQRCIAARSHQSRRNIWLCDSLWSKPATIWPSKQKWLSGVISPTCRLLTNGVTWNCGRCFSSIPLSTSSNPQPPPVGV